MSPHVTYKIAHYFVACKISTLQTPLDFFNSQHWLTPNWETWENECRHNNRSKAHKSRNVSIQDPAVFGNGGPCLYKDLRATYSLVTGVPASKTIQASRYMITETPTDKPVNCKKKKSPRLQNWWWSVADNEAYKDGWGPLSDANPKETSYMNTYGASLTYIGWQSSYTHTWKF